MRSTADDGPLLLRRPRSTARRRGGGHQLRGAGSRHSRRRQWWPTLAAVGSLAEHGYPLALRCSRSANSLRGAAGGWAAVHQRGICVELLLGLSPLQGSHTKIRVGIVVVRRIGHITTVHKAFVRRSCRRRCRSSRGANVVHRLVPRVFDDVGIARIEGEAAAAARLAAQRWWGQGHAHSAAIVMQSGHRVLFVLLPGFRVVLLLGALALPLHAEHHTGCDHGHQRHGHREDGYQNHLGVGQTIGPRLVVGSKLMGTEADRGVGLLVTLFPAEAIGADALEGVDSVHAGPSVVAGGAAALVDVHRAVLASEAGPTCALVVVVQVRTGSSVGTGSDQAEIHFAAAVSAVESGNTLATVLVDHVDAGASVLALVPQTVVDIGFTLRTWKSNRTHALSISLAGSSVLAGIRTAVVQLEFAGGSTVADGTLALVALTFAAQARSHISADALLAGFIRAGQDFLLAHPATPAIGAVALVAVFRWWLVHASAAVLAGINFGIARVDLPFAVIANESGGTLAGVEAFAGVEAGAAVLAGSVIGAVVEVLVAVETAPALVADAGPGLVASSVDAVWFYDAFVAQRSLPSQVATVIREENNLGWLVWSSLSLKQEQCDLILSSFALNTSMYYTTPRDLWLCLLKRRERWLTFEPPSPAPRTSAIPLAPPTLVGMPRLIAASKEEEKAAEEREPQRRGP